MNAAEPLVATYLDDALSETERAELNAWLKVSPANLRQFTEAVMFEQQIRAAAQAQALQPAAAEFVPELTENFGLSWFSRWLSWRPLAAGIILGIFCASFAWAYVNPHAPKSVPQLLPLANPGFEEPVAPSSNGTPTNFAIWSGDYAEIVGAQPGVLPKEGQRMLRFLRSDSAVSAGLETNQTANIYQVIDMRPWRQLLRAGQAQADWSA